MAERPEIHIKPIRNRADRPEVPCCGKPADGGTMINDRPGGRSDPTPGDFSVCLYCGSLLRYTEGGLRRIERTERRQMMRDERLSQTAGNRGEGATADQTKLAMSRRAESGWNVFP